MSAEWLSDNAANRYNKTYMKGFLDISGGDLIVRNHNVYVRAGDVSINGDLLVSYDTSLNGKLFVRGDASMDSVLAVANDVSLNSKLFVRGDASMDSVLAVANDVSLNSKLFVRSDVSMDSVLMVAKDVSFNSKLFVRSDVSMDSILMVAKDVSFNSKLFVRSDVSMDSILMVAKDVSFNSKLFVRSDVSMDSVLMVANDVSFNSKLFVANDVSFNKNLVVGGDVIIRGNMSVYQQQSNTVINTTVNNYRIVNTLDISVNGNLVVSSDVSLNSKLFVKGDVSMDSILMVAKDVSFNSKFMVANDASFNSKFTVRNDVSFNSKFTVANDVSFGSKLNVGADASFNSKLSVTNDVSFNSKFTVLNDVSFNSRFTVANDVSFGSKLNVGADASFNSKLSVTNDVSFNSKFTVLNDVSFNSRFTVANDVSFGSKLNVGADASFNSKLSVTNDVSFNSKFTVLNDVSFNSRFTVANDVSFGSKLNVGSDASFNSKLSVTNDVSFNSKFTVRNDVSFNSRFTVANDVSFGSKLNVGADASFNSKLSVTNDVSFNSKFTVLNDVSFNSRFTVANDVSFGSKLNVGADASFNSKLSVTNDVSFNSKFTVRNDVSFNSRFTVANDVSFGSKLNVGSDASFNSKLSVGNDVYFNSKFTVRNDVSFNSRFTVANDVSFGSKLNVGSDASFNSKLYLSNSSLYMNSAPVNSTATELNYLNGVTPGTALASKALVTNSGNSITGLTSISATTFTGTNLNVTTITGTLDGAANKYKVTNVDTLSNAHYLPLSSTATNSNSSDVLVSSKLFFEPLSNKLSVGNITLSGKLVVAGDVSFNGRFTVANDVSFGSKLNVGDTLTIKQTIRSTANTIDLSANYLIVPRSNTTDTNVAGTIRYNTTSSTFEGYTASWNSLGGTVSTNKYVRVDASDNLGLSFYTGRTAAIERMRIDNSGDVNIYNNFVISDGNAPTISGKTILKSVSSGKYTTNASAVQIGTDINVISGSEVTSVSLSKNGNIVAFGAGLLNMAAVYQYTDNAWKKLGQNINGEFANDYFGNSVSLSADGLTVAIGANSNDGTTGNVNDDRGHVRVYKYNGSAWQQLGLDIDGIAVYDYSSWQVSLSADGLTVAISSVQNNNQTGYVRVFRYNGSDWIQRGLNITGQTLGEKSGYSVSINSDGTIVAIGAPFNDAGNSISDNRGCARIYKYNFSNTTWEKLGLDIVGAASNDTSGWSISLSSDGYTVAIGANGNDASGNLAGQVRVFTYKNDAWQKIGQDINGEAAGDYSGTSVSLSADGLTVAIGAYSNDAGGAYSDDFGHVRIYQYIGTTWQQLGLDIDGRSIDDYLGNLRLLSLSADGTAVATATNNGIVRVYQLLTPINILSINNQVQINGLTIGSANADISTNSAVGNQALTSITVGNQNSAYGYQALLLNYTGSNNTAIGYQAGDLNTTGSNNTFLGSLTDTSGTTWSNSTAIGYNAKITASNQIVLGTSAETINVPGNTSFNGKLLVIGDASFNGNVSISDSSGINVLLKSVNIGKYCPLRTPVQLGQDIDGEAAGDQSGTSVSISDDGTIVAIGAYYFRGYVRVYKYDVNKLTNVTDQSSPDFGPIGWRRLGQDIDGEADYDESGYSVSLSSDGTIVAIGAVKNDGTPALTDRGHVRIYKYDVNKRTNVTNQSSSDFGPIGWIRLGQDIDGEAASDQSGTSVSLSADGYTVAIGAVINAGNVNAAGHVRVYKYQTITDASWNSYTINSFTYNGTAPTDKPIVVNGGDALPVSGKYYWVQMGVDIDGEAAVDWSGWSVSLSADGTIVAIGAIYNDETASNAGHVRVYKYDVNKLTNVTDQSSNDFGPIGWRRLGKDIDGEANSDQFGISLSLSADGTTVAIGANYNDAGGVSTVNRGHVRVYKYDASKNTLVTDPSSNDFGPIGWRRLGQDIDGEAAGNYSGFSVSLSADGTIVAIGAPGNDAGRGSGRIYKYNGLGWNQICGDIDGEAYSDQSGWSVSLSADGNIVAIGANYNDGSGNGVSDNRGHVRVYQIQSIPNQLQINKQVEINGLTIGSVFADISTNSAIGYQALDSVIVGNQNSAFGYQTLLLNTSGNNNTAIGYQAGDLNTTGSNNTFLGSLADTTNTWSNSTAVGYNAKITASNQIVLGTSAETINIPGTGININAMSLSSESYIKTAGVLIGQINGEAASDQSGWSVSMNSDGTIVAIGAIYNDGTTGTNDSRGHVRVYKYQTIAETAWTNYTVNSFKYTGTSPTNKPIVVNGRDANPVSGKFYWVQLGADIDGEATNDSSGWSISLSSDGLTVAIGANQNDGTTGTNDSRGHVRVYKYQTIAETAWTNYTVNSFTYTGTSPTNKPIVVNGGDANPVSGKFYWVQLGADIDGEATSDNSGYSVSMNSAGTIVAIGAIYNNGTTGFGTGHVRIYQYIGTTWQILGQEIDGEFGMDYSGTSVSLSSIGTIVAIGATRNPGGATLRGHVRVYQYNDTTWTKLGADIDGIVYGGGFGTSVSLSSDGTIVAIGAPISSPNDVLKGSVRVFKYNGSNWNQLGQTLNNTQITNSIPGRFGISVSLSSDGNTLAIGDDIVNNRGGLRIYKYIVNAWYQITTDILGEVVDEQFGYAVSLSKPGDTFVIGAPSNSGAGSVYIYKLNSESTKLSISNDVTINGLSIGRGNTNIITNCVFGNQTSNSGGFQTCAFGYKSLYLNMGKNNSAFGYLAGQLNTTGSNNTFIGADTDISPTSATWSDSTAIGANAKITASNQIMLGTSTEVVRVLGWVSVAGNVTASSHPSTSDYRIKDYVTSLSDCSFTVDVLRPVSYHNKVTDKPDIGLIAHEVQEHFPFLVSGEKDGETMQTVNYTGLIGLLIHEIQQLKRRVSDMERRT